MSEEQSTYSANPGKQLVRTVDGVDYQGIPVKTHLITNTDDMADVVVRYAKDRMQEGDILFISEKAVACTQNRAIPMEDINLHFTGDFHAIGAANNLLAAMLDNHIQQGNALDIDVKNITWRRCVDMNDR